MHHLKALCLLAISAVLSAPLHAQVSVPHEFAAGEKAVATEVNANFQALAGALASALTKIEELETELVTLKTSNALALDEFVEVIPDPNVSGGTTVRFVGVNVQLVSGSGATDGEVNGLGNLIVGYNEATDATTEFFCSNHYRTNQYDCEAGGGVWDTSHKSGSHNLIVGQQHNYTHYAGFVAGHRNTVNGQNATVSGGRDNVAGYMSSISGGAGNRATSDASSVSGGSNNTASGAWSSVSGGASNEASIHWSTVVGGQDNTAGGYHSVVVGGRENIAHGEKSVVASGRGNSAEGNNSIVLGGSANSAVSTNSISPE